MRHRRHVHLISNILLANWYAIHSSNFIADADDMEVGDRLSKARVERGREASAVSITLD